jgi:hypothetical protein
MCYHGNVSYFFRILKYLGCKSIKRFVTPAGFAKLFLQLRLVDHLACHAPVHDYVFTINEAVFTAAKEEACSRNVLRPADASGKMLTVVLLPEPAVIAGLDPARTDAVYPDMILTE